jgi:rod shape-determining protein MreC
MRLVSPGFVRLVIILSLCVLLITLDSLGIFKARYALNYLFTPIERLVGALRNIQDVQRQLAELSAEPGNQNESYSQPELGLENAQLRQLLGIPFSLPFTILPATVIDSSTQLGKHYILIDRGSLSGCTPGQTVVSGNYLIGEIDEVGLSESRVKLLGADSLSVAVYLPRSGFPGILRARSDGTLEIHYLPPRAEVMVGDLVYTSGLGGVFPRGLLIGEVSKAESISGELFLDCQIKPSPDLYSPTVIGVLLPANPPLPPETPSIIPAWEEKLSGESPAESLESNLSSEPENSENAPPPAKDY